MLYSSICFEIHIIPITTTKTLVQFISNDLVVDDERVYFSKQVDA